MKSLGVLTKLIASQHEQRNDEEQAEPADEARALEARREGRS